MRTKNESIKLRVTKEQKEKLKYLSKQNNESMSVYILRKSMEEKISSYRFISDKIDICNLLNEIYHGLVMSDGRQTEQEVRKIFQTMKSSEYGLLLNKARKGKYSNFQDMVYLIRYVTRTNGKPDNDLITWGGIGVAEFIR